MIQLNSQSILHFNKYILYILAMDDGVSQLTHTSRELVGKHHTTFKKEFTNFGKSFGTIANAFKQHQTPQSNTLTDAMKHTGKAYSYKNLFRTTPAINIKVFSFCIGTLKMKDKFLSFYNPSCWLFF